VHSVRSNRTSCRLACAPWACGGVLGPWRAGATTSPTFKLRLLSLSTVSPPPRDGPIVAGHVKTVTLSSFVAKRMMLYQGKYDSRARPLQDFNSGLPRPCYPAFTLIELLRGESPFYCHTGAPCLLPVIAKARRIRNAGGGTSRRLETISKPNRPAGKRNHIHRRQ
jgi:hypothetical protein